jgi:hypothetical protein
MIDLDKSSLGQPRPDLSGCATGNKNYPKMCREDRSEVKINGKVISVNTLRVLQK